MKKIIAVLICILFVLAAFTSCGSKEKAPTGTKQVESEFLNYKLYVPKDWTVDVSTGFAAASDSKGRSVSVTEVSPEGDYSSIDEYYRNYYWKTVSDTFANAALTESYTENQTLGGYPACRYVLSFEIGGTQYTAMQVVGVHGYNLYVFTYFSSADLYADGLETVEEILGYFAY